MITTTTESKKEWLTKLFEFEDCEECEQGAENHTAIVFLGNFFAVCAEVPA